MMNRRPLEIRANLEQSYPDILTREALAVLAELVSLDADRKAVMRARIDRRARRARERTPIAFLDRGSGFKGPDRRRGRMRRSKRVFATWPMRCSPARMGGCSMAKTRLASCRRWPSTTSAT
jgi:hypothetical protein